MSLTPNNSRMMSPALGAGIKLNPSPSPFFRSTPLRSPIKTRSADTSLALRQVIGTTANTANAFDSLPTGRCFAYTAGAAAVIATIGQDHQVSQRFFRARPTANPTNPSTSIYGGPSTPTQNESRNRTAASLRDAGFGNSPLASPSINDWSDSPSNRTLTSKDKVKAAACVSFSPDGKYLAVGESGYKPRVLIFSTASDAPSDTPLTSLPDHTQGVICVAFSPDSRYLASLGCANDGFLYIWSINQRTGAASLYASNKCVSSINRIAWMGNKVITVGTRHVKVWRVDEPTSSMRISKARQSDLSFLTGGSTYKTLPGRNCILEGLKEAIFTSVVSISTNRAIVASEKGDICLIDDTSSDQRLIKLFEAGFSVSSMATDTRGRLHLASSQGGLKTVNIREVISNLILPPSPAPSIDPSPVPWADCDQIVAIVCSNDYVITVDSSRALRLSHICSQSDETAVGDLVHTLPAHGNAVLGVAAVTTQPNMLSASHYTWASDGTILFWSTNGSFKDVFHAMFEQIEDPDASPNELRTVCVSSNASYLVTGDKYGVLRVLDCGTRTSTFEFKAHAGEITSIAIHEDHDIALIACASRDRTVQVFTRSKETWELLQTLDEHVGSVNAIQFSRSGKKLISSSSDRSIVVRELVSREEGTLTIRAFLMLRAIMLKASPVSMAWDVDQDDALVISTIDRQVHKYDLHNGQCIQSFRACDTDGGDAVVLSSLVHIPRGWASPLIAGVSSTDKSIRIYEENGSLVARDWGHTGGVSDIALVQEKNVDGNDGSKSLVTVAVDGTIFIWDLALQTPTRNDMSRSMDLLSMDSPSAPDLVANRPPLRRIFSQSELARFQRPNEDDNNNTPTGNRSPKLRKRLSKFTLAQTPKLEPSPMPSIPRESRATGWQGQGSIRRNKNRSPSPLSPRNPQLAKQRASTDVRLRTKAPANEFGSLGASTESLCRTLRAYRKRLANSTDSMTSELAREVERELAATARAIGDCVKSKEFEETVMVKLLDQYSERLVTMLDEKIAASVAQRVRENSVGNFSEGDSVPSNDRSPLREREDSEATMNLAVVESPSETIVESVETIETAKT